ncbi:MAG: metallophosphoesterase, partial [Anaerolineae bacterium]|nr:metallophosphoesterase [Anaerolineae bacterium]
MRFVHISDTHVGPTPDYEYHGHRPLAQLERLVELINALTFPVDFVLHTGDVVNSAQEVEYALAAPALARLRLPIYYVAGNHDDPAHMRRLLLGQDANDARFDYQFGVGGLHFAVLDTRSP